MQNHNCRNFDYDVSLSFAGENRKYVEQVASYLRKSGLSVFYDKYEKVNLWGKDLYQHLDHIYQQTSKYVVLFISKHYAKKLWTNHELKSAQARAFSENEEYILPARFDKTDIPGIRKTIGYINLVGQKPSDFAKLIIEKLSKFKLENILPSDASKLKQLLKVEGWDIEPEDIDFVAHNIFKKLKLLSQNEKSLLANILFNGCQHNLPNDIHIEAKVLERYANISLFEIKNILNGITGLGFDYKIKKVAHGNKNEGNHHKENVIYLSLSPLSTEYEYGNIILILVKMLWASCYGMCSDCAFDSFLRLDFSELEKSFSKKELIEITIDN